MVTTLCRYTFQWFYNAQLSWLSWMAHLQSNCHVNATEPYMHFGYFAGDAILCSKFFWFFIVFRHHISFIRTKLLGLQFWTKSLIVCFTSGFQINRKLHFAQMSVTTFLHSYDELLSGYFTLEYRDVSHYGENFLKCLNIYGKVTLYGANFLKSRYFLENFLKSDSFMKTCIPVSNCAVALEELNCMAAPFGVVTIL